jgi:crotonobetainyl-CoA:carnitine CoA-transferase CaiB-like acyl-CoA transferase
MFGLSEGDGMTLLSPYRALDLTDEGGHLAGHILARLGADVIAVEPPGGSPVRRLGPFAPDGSSLTHSAYARGKRSVEFDLGTGEGLESFRRLVAGSDLLIESWAPGELASMGLGPSELAVINPSLIVVSITPFGQTGPKAGWAATDLTVWAAGGPAALCGDEDRAPLQVSVPQAFLHAGAQAASAAVVALLERSRSGLGQHIDVSAQVVAMNSTQSSALCSLIGSALVTRAGGGIKGGAINLRFVYPASDGYVSITHVFGASIGPTTARLMDLVHEAGFCDEATRDKDWVEYAMALGDGRESMEDFEKVKSCVEAFTSSKTKAELFELAQRRRVLLAPVATVEEVVNSEQLAARGYWEEVDGIKYPGAWIGGGVSRLQADSTVPEVGEHTQQILAEVRSPAVEITRSTHSDVLPLAGLKVLDFMWALAGPAVSRLLTDAGATVVRVESSTKLDAGRTFLPFLNNEVGIENGGLFNNLNTDKQGITLNLNTDAGLGVAKDLCKWADVVCEAYAPRAMKAWGLDYENIKKLNPSIVMLSTCLFGQSGPLADFAGYGNLGGAMTGFYSLTGWPDRPPVGPFGAITDYTSPHPAAATLLAAIDHQRRTGEGQYLDFSQAEASIQFIAPALLDFQHNGRIAGARGNSSDRACPHGIFPTSGDDEWVAVVAQDDAAWVQLAELVGHPELADQSLAERLTDSEALEGLVADWTRELAAEEVEARCQSSGIAAHRVQNSPELATDPQLAHRGHWVEVEHSLHGKTIVEAARFVMSRTPIGPRRAAPMLGEHLFETLTDQLGYNADQIAELAAAEAFD